MSDPRNVVDLEALRAQVEARNREEAEGLASAAPPKKEDGGGGPDDPRFVFDCLANNERGDGILFAALHRGRFVCNKSKKDKAWMKWAGHHWQYDHLDEAVRAVEQVALTYLQQAGRISEEIAEMREHFRAAEKKAEAREAADDLDGAFAARAEAERLSGEIERAGRQRAALTKRVDRLRSVRGAGNCLTWAHCIDQPLAIVGDEIDRRPWLLPCQNGVVDLRTGELHPGRPDDLLVRAVPVAFPEGPEVRHYLATGEGFQGENWERFIREIHQEDQPIIDCVHRVLGYAVTGLRTEHFIACFIGEGANGKGTLFETLHDTLGELAWSIEPELILQQKNARNASGPNAEIMSLQGRRLVVASETEEHRRISAAKVKRLTGGDTLTGRAPHDKYEINFRPTHKLVLYTNHPPKGLASDFAMFRRLLYFWYPLRYVDDPEHHRTNDPQNAHIYRQKDGGLPDKLKEEASWILAWLVRGCLLWQAEGGINPPAKLRAAAEAIRLEEDLLGRFLEDVAEQADPDDRVPFKEFYDRFSQWYGENVDDSDRYRPKKKAVTDQLRRKGYRVPSARETGGQVYVYGVDLPMELDR